MWEYLRFGFRYDFKIPLFESGIETFGLLALLIADQASIIDSTILSVKHRILVFTPESR